jgi:hypothetical protein
MLPSIRLRCRTRLCGSATCPSPLHLRSHPASAYSYDPAALATRLGDTFLVVRVQTYRCAPLTCRQRLIWKIDDVEWSHVLEVSPRLVFCIDVFLASVRHHSFGGFAREFIVPLT